MTRPGRTSTHDLVRARFRVLEAEGRVAPSFLPAPSASRACPAGYTVWRVRITVDGHRRTRAEAAATFAHQTFARSAVDAGMSGGWYLWHIEERLDPRSTR